MAKLNFGGTEENVVTRDEFPLSKAQEVLKDEVVAVIGYGVQGPGQALNQKENGINVIVGQRKNSKSWDKAVNDGFVPGETLFEIEEALQRGTIICYLLSDAAQIAMWPTVKANLTPGKALYFSHGFGITYNEQTGIIPPADVDVFLVAPKGSGTSLRRMFLQGRGLNSSYAIHQDATGRAFERVVALGIAIGSGCLYYGEKRRRTEVVFDPELRQLVIETAAALHAMIAARQTPLAVYEPRRCDACSLIDECLPKTLRFKRGAAAWFLRESQI